MNDHERLLLEDSIQYAIEAEARYLKMRKIAFFFGGLSIGLFFGVCFII